MLKNIEPRILIFLLQKANTWTRLQIWCGSFVLTIAVVALSVAYLDRPVSRIGESVLGRFALIRDIPPTRSFFTLLALLVFGTFLLRRLATRPFGKLDVACLLSGASLLLTNFVNGKMKYFFGRAGPKYGYPSFIHNGVYGFYPAHPGHAYESFPSGHVAAVCAMLSVLWIFYPGFRKLYASAAIGFASALIVTNYHFLADVIAGGFLGVSSGLICVSAWELLDRHFSPESRTVGAFSAPRNDNT